MFKWVQKNQKLAAKITGINFLLMTLLMLFWSQPKEGMSEEERAAANVARMEARVEGSSGKSSPSNLNLMKKHQETQKAQLRVTLILMSLCGFGFLIYGFLKKDDSL